MKYRVIVQPPALEDLDYAYQRAAAHAPETAFAWQKGFHVALQTLENNPERCSVAPESSAFEAEIRQFFYRTKSRHAYRALFTIRDQSVFVLHIRSPGQPPMHGEYR